jgi:hypothetical protein
MSGKMKDADRLPIMMVRTRNGLSPAAPFDAERLDRYGMGATVEVRVMQRRSSPQNRLYWSILARVVEQTEEWPTAERLHDAIKLHLGYAHPFRRVTGETVWIPDSTAFSQMPPDEFRTFMDRALELISQHILPGVDPMTLVKEGEQGLAA